MLRHLYVCTILALLGLQTLSEAKAELTRQPVDVLGEVAIVRDVTSIDFAAILSKQDVSWIMAKINPDRFSGGGYGGGGEDFIRVNGNFYVIAALTSKPEKTDYAYQWDFPIDSYPRTNALKLFAPLQVFIDGGTAVFPITEDLKDSSKVLPIFPIPVEWEKFVLPAWKYYQSNATLFGPEDTSKNREQLQKLTDGKNPLLAIAACRMLAKAHRLDSGFINGALAKATGLRQAAFTVLFLGQAQQPPGDDEGNGKKIDEALNQLIAESISAEPLRGIALGALSGLRDLDYAGSVRAFHVLDAIDKKQAVFNTHTDADKFVKAIIKIAALPLLRQSPIYNEGANQPLHSQR